ncbi:carbamoyl-phosphate synthase large subunit [Lentisphaera profundi]|uniref:Carbamoyl phosphate synthase large chain n=1 Tax=Lentisphaera profundi TaxID=1658616 RepID=A0ABY7VN47_9BACT|nr:carbamoyl-phosphate synthase large subunit [Lentisphaera profundi]WDE95505.1 carbamoyl-phosphate synthase large subunit [Lentisphaera profundi]
MPKRDDIKRILLLGSGPIVIGQACEFDYSGTQACKALREEGYEVVLVNSNPATIMTDPEFSDRTYIEPLTNEFLEKIIDRERPDAILPTLGGQTALNAAINLDAAGILAKYNVQMLGATPDVIDKAENRDRFRIAMENIGLDMPRCATATDMEGCYKVREWLGDYPLIIRPSFTMGGSGGGIAYNDEDFDRICGTGMDYSPTHEVLIDESILGWKEYELEVIRDKNDNAIIVCSIENFDPVGVHTGDSITVAPIQTLSDREYQIMRDKSIAVLREVGVETGGSNVQWAVCPETGRMVIIEMNPRVSRSSALASKATGFPIAKIAAKLAVGYTLDELQNDITQSTPACFEPSIDYVVTKIPRFTFEKFAGAEDSLNTQMKSVGEVMAIGKTFKQSFQKALRGMEIGRFGFGADGKDAPFENADDKEITRLLADPNSQRTFALRAAFKRGWSVERVFDICKIDPWFLRHLEELVAYEGEIQSAGDLEGLTADAALFRQAKEFGYSDPQIAYLLSSDADKVRAARKKIGLTPSFNLVDTCAAEFSAVTPYYYSTYSELNEVRPTNDKKTIMIIGGGPNRIGQGIEFDYCCVHASFALREAGFETIMVNSNPETVSTDYDTSDKLYFEPLTLEDVLAIYEAEDCDGAIVQFGGQTPLNLAAKLKENGVNVIGTSPESIEQAEDRDFFQKLVTELDIKQPENGMAVNVEEALIIAERIEYPVLVRPSFVLGGRAMAIVYDEAELSKYMETAVDVSDDRPILVDKFLDDAVEVDVDCISDGETSVIGAIMEHVEPAGVHSGDSATCIPSMTLSDDIKDVIRKHTYNLAKALKVRGLMNIQYAVQEGEVYIIEVNPRASRTIPYVSKAIGVPMAKYASLVMAGQTLKELGFTEEVEVKYWSVKEAVFPFVRFPGHDVILSPEMKSTGEVMGISGNSGLAFLKAQVMAGNKIPEGGAVMITVMDRDKDKILPHAKDLAELGFELYATKGTATFLCENGVKVNALFKISEGQPNTLNLIKDGSIKWIINTPTGSQPRKDEVAMRAAAIMNNIPMTTTIPALAAAVSGLKHLGSGQSFGVLSLQEIHS